MLRSAIHAYGVLALILVGRKRPALRLDDLSLRSHSDRARRTGGAALKELSAVLAAARIARVFLLFAGVAIGAGCGGAGVRGRDGAAVDGGGIDGGDALQARHSFRKLTLSADFTCEGATFGDFNRDGARDVVAGPFWYQGPTFAVRHQLYPPVAFDPKGYSDCFFMFVHDFDGDGWDDVLQVGFPGQAASWLRNPGAAQTAGTSDAAWERHLVAPAVDDESPAFTDLTGDGLSELVFSTAGYLGWAVPDPARPNEPWTFHPLSPPEGFGPFTHGLGVGDLDGDGRPDVLEATAWWQQPASLLQDPPWPRRPQSFGSGGAQMLTVDVDGDGDADVITSLAAHGSGLAWYEQQADGKGGTAFVQHVIVPQDETASTVALHEPHALALSDIDGDGLPDIVTGERFWGHVPGGNPDFAAPARIYWFQLVRGAGGASFVPHLIDDASGVGTQVVAGDVTGDGLADIVVANKKGAFVMVHELK